MDIVLLLFRQNIIMILYMLIGVFLYKKNLVTEKGSGEFGKLLVYIVMPAVILKAYIVEFSTDILLGLGISMLAAAVCLLLSILVSRIVFKNDPIEHFGCAFSNAGFIGIPLVQAVLGTEAVFYVSSFVAFLNILQWTYGVYIMTGDKTTISAKKIATNPVVLAFVVGIILFFLPIQLPEIFTTVIGSVAGMNAPLAMIILGIYLAQLPLREILKGKQVYLATLVRLIVIPLITFGVLSLLPMEFRIIKLTALIAAAAPVGSNVAIFAQMNNKDYTQAVKDVCLSTLLCIITLPLIVGLANILWS